MKKYLLLLISLCLFGCQTQMEKNSESFLSFDTYIDFTAYTSNKDDFNKYFEQTKKEFTEYHQLFDAYNNYKGINNVKVINDNAGQKAVKVDEKLYNLIKKSQEYYKDSFQKNNITLAPVVSVYKEVQEKYNDGMKVTNPEMSLLKKKAGCVGMVNIVLNDKDSSVYLKKSCAQIDVGSIAKGYAADEVAKSLEEEGLTSGIINAGGNVVVIGKKNNDDFTVGIANPDDSNSFKMTLKASDINIVTSGDYQRYYIIDGKRMNHIIDPDTLRPAQENKSVTIINHDGLVADYFSTECFMLDISKIKELATKYKFEYIIIDKNDKITISEGIKDAVEVK